MILTFRYRLLPSKKQHRILETILEGQRELYNAALQERIEAYRKAGVSRTYIDQAKAVTDWRRDDPGAASVALNIHRATLRRLDVAYRTYLRRIKAGHSAGMPRFRGKGWFDSFAFAEFRGITLKGRSIRFKGMRGSLPVHMHRPLPINGLIKGCVFKRDVKGWHIAFAVQLPAPNPRDGNRIVGVDLGITTFATLSDGSVLPSLRAARKAHRRMRVAQRALARKTPASRGRQKARVLVRRCHAATARRRRNHLHQASARLVQMYDVIAVEKLNVKGLARSILARDVHDASWSTFIAYLRYKAEKAGARLIEVDPRNTTQDCSGCGNKVSKSLDDRWHVCSICGLSIDRDLNAALNILSRARVGPGLPNAASFRAHVQAETSV